MTVSPLAWGRGLKPDSVNGSNAFNQVAPRVGAWIETQPMMISRNT